MSTVDVTADFVRQLYAWNHDLERKDHDGGRHPRAAEARAAFASLRHSVGKSLGEDPAASRYLFRLVPDDVVDPELSVYSQVAGLFAGHLLPRERSGDGRRHNLGHVFREMEQRQQPDEPVEAYERRFVALLNASRERLPGHLRHAIRLAASKRVPIDWYSLTRDALSWQNPEGRERVKLAWARAYWGHSPRSDAEAPATTEVNA